MVQTRGRLAELLSTGKGTTEEVIDAACVEYSRLLLGLINEPNAAPGVPSAAPSTLAQTGQEHSKSPGQTLVVLIGNLKTADTAC